MSNFKGTVAASDNMFRTIARTHIQDSWMKTLIKEIWQNTIDLPVTQLDISVEVLPYQEGLYDEKWMSRKPSFCKAVFKDNGPGMSLGLLKSVYLFYGETTKANEPDSVGGYGLGRVVCTFGAVSYRLRSHNWECKGVGGSFEIQEGLPFQKGLELEVTFPSVNRTGLYMEPKFEVQSYINLCHSNRIQVTINNSPYKLKKFEDTGFTLTHNGEIWGSFEYTSRTVLRVWAVNKKGDSLFLYESPLYGTKRGINLYVKAGLTKEAMNISRDAFSGEYGDQVNQLTASLYEEYRKENEDQVYEEGELPEFESIPYSKSEGDLEGDQQNSGVPNQGIKSFTSSPQAQGSIRTPRQVSELIKTKKQNPPPYIIICKEAEKPEMEKLKKGTDSYFFAIWTGLVHIITKAMLPSYTNKAGGNQFTTALILQKNVYGSCRTIEGTTHGSYNHVILANPSLINSFPLLVATAIHECCHMAEDYHGESFAALQTFMMSGMYGIRFHELEKEWEEYVDAVNKVSKPKPKKVIPNSDRSATPKPILKKKGN